MATGNGMYITILGSSTILLGCVAMILVAIVILKKSKKYNKFRRVLMISLLLVTSGTAAYLVYLAFALGSTAPPALPIPLH